MGIPEIILDNKGMYNEQKQNTTKQTAMLTTACTAFYLYPGKKMVSILEILPVPSPALFFNS